MATIDSAESATGRRAVGRPLWLAVLGGASIGLLGGLVGLGGAEFRLPLLVSLFGFIALQAVIVNKAMSLVVVLVALPSRLIAVPLSELTPHWSVVVNLLAGSIAGAWAGASWATRMRERSLYRVLGVLLALIAVVFAADHAGTLHHLSLAPVPHAIAGVVAGFGIGVVAAVMGVAGGELLIPTIVLLFGIDLKFAGSLSLIVSLPTMLTAFLRYSQDQSFAVIRHHPHFIVAMAAGSVVGSIAGGLLVGVVPEAVLVPLVVGLLVASAVKVWRHS